MTSTEAGLLVVLGIVFSVYTFVFRQNVRANAVVFLLGCAIGFLAQLPLGPELNRYTSNISLYISYVSVAVIITWGIGLTSFHAAHLWAARLAGVTPGLTLYFLCGVPIIAITEIIGSNVLSMKLHNYPAYSPLMPQFNAMHAPAWLYAYYGFIAWIFFYLLKALRIGAGDQRPPARREPGLS